MVPIPKNFMKFKRRVQGCKLFSYGGDDSNGGSSTEKKRRRKRREEFAANQDRRSAFYRELLFR